MTRLFDQLLRITPCGVLVVDRELTVTLANAAMAGLVREAPDAVTGRPLAEVLPAAAFDVLTACRQVLARGEPVTGRELGGGRRAGPGASTCWRADVRPLDGGAVAVVVEDVTAHHRAVDQAAALEALTEELPGASGTEVEASRTVA